MFRPRPYQREAVEAFARGVAEGLDSMLFVMPTGSGKSAVGLMALARRGGRTLWVANRAELLEQAAEQARDILPGTVGYVTPGRCETQRQHVFASIDTLRGRLSDAPNWAPFDAVMCDEVHHLRAPSWERAVTTVLESARARGRRPVLGGLTATVERGDGKTLGKWFRTVAFDMTVDDAIEVGALVPWVVERVVVPRLGAPERGKNGDVNQRAAAADWERSNAAEVVAAETARRLGERKAIIFVPDVRQAQRTAATLRSLGVAAEWTSGPSVCAREGRERREGDGERARREKREAFKQGRFRAMACASLWLEGFDDRTVSMVVMGRHTTSPVVYRQAVGRGLRATLPGDRCPKRDCLVLDLVGAHEKIGLQSATCLRTAEAPESEGLRVLHRVGQETDDPDPSLSRVRKFLDAASGGTPAILFWRRKAPWERQGRRRWALRTLEGDVVLEEVQDGRWTASVLYDGRRQALGRIPLPTDVAQAVAEEVARSMGMRCRGN